jgi:hypothetical protein
MNTQSQQGKSDKKGTLIVIALFVIGLLLYFAIMSLISPGRRLAEIKSRYDVRRSDDKTYDSRLFSDSAYVDLFKEKAFLQAKIAMAETDSVSLSLNLEDSTAVLEINGVNVHSVKIEEFSASKLLLSGDPVAIASMLSVPLNIVGDYSTIRKEPLMIKMAPKDTSEFKPDIIPDTSDFEPVDYILDTDLGIRIYIYQKETAKASDRRRLFFFDLNDRLRTFFRSLKAVLVLKVPEYNPYIKIRLPKADAKIIYRAIPRDGQIAIYI